MEFVYDLYDIATGAIKVTVRYWYNKYFILIYLLIISIIIFQPRIGILNFDFKRIIGHTLAKNIYEIYI